MRTVSVLAIGAAVALTSATLAIGTGAAAAVQGDKGAEDKSRRVCRTIVPVGSRLTRRICRTQEDWDAAREKTQTGVLDQQMDEFTQPAQQARPGVDPR